MLLFVLAGCLRTTSVASDPLVLTITTPTYGEFVGDGAVLVTGVVSPAHAQILVNRTMVRPDANGAFSVEVPFPTDGAGAEDRALVLDIFALDGLRQVREIVPVFDGVDPRLSDPGGIAGLLTPTGLDALEPLVEEQIDALGWEDQILSVLPSFESDYVSLVPNAVTSTGSSVDLAPGLDNVGLAVGLNDVTVLTDVTIAGTWTFTMGISLGVISIGAEATPDLADDMLTLSLSDADVVIDEVGFSIDSFEAPDWLTELLVDPVFSLVGDLGSLLGDLLLDQLGTIELGGPFAFETDLMGTPLSARLVDVGADMDGVSLGATISTEGEAADTFPDIPALTATTASGLSYQLGLSVHEGLFNTLLDETLAGMLDFELVLEGSMAELLGAGISALPGGDEIPMDSEGFCIGIEAGDARVVRLTEGTGAPLAAAWLPDLRFDVDTIQEGDCEEWLQTSLFAVVELSLDGTAINADFSVKAVSVLAYGAAEADRDEVAAELGTIVEGLAGLAMGQLSFDLGDVVGADLPIEPTVVAVEALDDEGLYGLYLDVF